MGNCKNCKYWKTLNDGYRTWSICDNVDSLEHSDKIARDGFAIFADCHDNSGMYAGLKTGPDFGCIKFIEK